jgi:hypothetical protein
LPRRHPPPRSPGGTCHAKPDPTRPNASEPLRKIRALEAGDELEVASWELAPTVPANSGWWLLTGDDELIELSRDDLRRRGWDLP